MMNTEEPVDGGFLLRAVAPFVGRLRATVAKGWEAYDPTSASPGCEKRDEGRDVTSHFVRTIRPLFPAGGIGIDRRVRWLRSTRAHTVHAGGVGELRVEVVAVLHRSDPSASASMPVEPLDDLVLLVFAVRVDNVRDWPEVAAAFGIGAVPGAKSQGISESLMTELARELILEGTSPIVAPFYYERRVPGHVVFLAPLKPEPEERHGDLLAVATGLWADTAGFRQGIAGQAFAEGGVEPYNGWSALCTRDNLVTWLDVPLDARARAHAEDDHFYTYLLVLWTKMRAQQLFDASATAAYFRPGAKAASHGRREQFEHLLGEWLRFRNRFWSRDASRNSGARALYRRMNDATGLPELIAEIHEEIDAMTTYARLESEREERDFERRLGWLAFLYLPMGTFAALLGMNVFTGDRAPPIAAIAIVVVVAALPAVILERHKLRSWLWRRELDSHGVGDVADDHEPR